LTAAYIYPIMNKKHAPEHPPDERPYEYHRLLAITMISH